MTKTIAKTLTALFLLISTPLAAMSQNSDIFVPSGDCFPDPVLDSITLQGRTIYAEDRPITSGQLSYIMGKVNPTLHTQLRKGHTLCLISVGTLFAGITGICTGYYWDRNMEGSRHKWGEGLLTAGCAVSAASVCTFTVGLAKASKAKRTFKRDCFGISRVDFGAGSQSVAVRAWF